MIQDTGYRTQDTGYSILLQIPEFMFFYSAFIDRTFSKVKLSISKVPQGRFKKNKNARRPKEAHNAQILKEIEIVDRAGEVLKELDQH